MSFAVLVCKGIPLLWILTGQLQCIDKTATPEPQRVVCSGPAVPGLTPEQKAQTPLVVKRFMGKVQRNRIDNHCPETLKKN